MTKQELEEKVADLQEQLNHQGNPGVPVVRVRNSNRVLAAGDLDDDERDELVSAIQSAQDALEDGRLDRAQDILDGVLDEYEEEGEDDGDDGEEG